MPNLMSFMGTWDQFVKRAKSVTRRSRRAEGMREGQRYFAWAPGWPALKAGDVIEGIEWLPRWAPHGERWVCRDCGWKGPTDPGHTTLDIAHRQAAHAKARPGCSPIAPLVWRPPQRLPGTEGHRRIVSVRKELLGDITPDEVALEGFGDNSPESFIYMYCVGTAPKYDKARPVNRIEFEELS